MTPEPPSPQIVPPYGAGVLADLAASIAASLALPGFNNALSFSPAARACLLVVDGLGWELLRAHPAAAPFLSELAAGAQPVVSGFPATTATGLASICTAEPPGRHGMLGYQVRIPGTSELLNALRWDQRVDPRGWQPSRTVFERAAVAGVAAVHVTRSTFRGTGLTRALMRGADFRPADSMGALAAVAGSALAENPRALVVVYHGDLDATGHVHGAGSPAWVNQLAHVDKLAEQLASSLPPGARLYITADHGMTDIGAEDRLDLDAVPGIWDGLAVLGGEPRARYGYARPGAEADLVVAWRELLGDRAWVRSREEAVKEGWFGPVTEEYLPRIGDVIAAPAGTTALVATRTEPRESALLGMHGSLTPSDQLIPALSYPA